MQQFFEENPFFLSQLRLGIQIPHPSYRTHRWSPDFAFTSILGASDLHDIDLLELKGPAEKCLISTRVTRDSPRCCIRRSTRSATMANSSINPENHRKMMRQFGYIPQSARLAVVLGRDYDDKDKMAWVDKRRRQNADVEIITYDKILETQANQLSPIIAPTMTEITSLRFGGPVTADFFR